MGKSLTRRYMLKTLVAPTASAFITSCTASHNNDIELFSLFPKKTHALRRPMQYTIPRSQGMTFTFVNTQKPPEEPTPEPYTVIVTPFTNQNSFGNTIFEARTYTGRMSIPPTFSEAPRTPRNLAYKVTAKDIGEWATRAITQELTEQGILTTIPESKDTPDATLTGTIHRLLGVDYEATSECGVLDMTLTLTKKDQKPITKKYTINHRLMWGFPEPKGLFKHRYKGSRHNHRTESYFGLTQEQKGLNKDGTVIPDYLANQMMHQALELNFDTWSIFTHKTNKIVVAKSDK